MTSATVTLKIKQGTATTKPNGNHDWKQATELAAGATKEAWDPANWTVASSYWYYYKGMNKGGVGNGDDRENGYFDYPNQALTFTVGSNGNDVIERVVVKESAEEQHFTITQPSSTNSNTATIVETAHIDPGTADDHYYVFGNAGGNGSPPSIMCDPIIRNRT